MVLERGMIVYLRKLLTSYQNSFSNKLKFGTIDSVVAYPNPHFSRTGKVELEINIIFVICLKKIKLHLDIVCLKQRIRFRHPPLNLLKICLAVHIGLLKELPS